MSVKRTGALVILLVMVLVFSISGLVSAIGTEPTDSDGDGKLEISSLDHLRYLSEDGGADLSADYEQTADIDASDTFNWNDLAGFSPIGRLCPSGGRGDDFAGTYDGNGYEISYLYIDRSSEGCVGMFGYNRGTISNVSLKTVWITGNDYVGGLVGYNNGTVESSYATGNVDSRGYKYFGGLVGYNEGTVFNTYSTASVDGGDNFVGGLVGGNGGTVESSYATGDVYGYKYLGGLAGGNRYRRVINTYSTGSVTGSDLVGGLVGYNYGGRVSNSYSTGSVSGDGDGGGLVRSSEGTVERSYWNTETSGQSES